MAIKVAVPFGYQYRPHTCKHCGAPVIEVFGVSTSFACGALHLIGMAVPIQSMYCRKVTTHYFQKEKAPMIQIIDKREETPLKGTLLTNVPWGTVFSGRIGSHHGIWLATALGVVQFESTGSSSFSLKENAAAATECTDYKTLIATLTIE